MYKKFPILFPDLLADFQLIKGSSDDPDETDYELSEGNLIFKDKHFYYPLIICINMKISKF